MSSSGAGDAGAALPGGAAGPRAPRPWHFLQTRFWGEHKSAFGWHASSIPGDEVAPGMPDLLVLTRRVAPGVLLSYVPYGPAVAGENRAWCPGPEAAELGEAIGRAALATVGEVRRRLGRPPVLVRFDLPHCSVDPGFAGALDDGNSATTARRAPVGVQPPDTVVIDLSADEDGLLAAMHRKNRYNIRLAERKGVEVDEADASHLDLWYDLYRRTARRDGIAIHSREYYARLLELPRTDGGVDLRLYLARHEGDVLAGIIVVRYSGGATYLYGASSDEKRNLMPNYALQWRAIVDARRDGCAWYDLYGVPPTDDPSHPMHGLYRFKCGFGGIRLRRLGCWDVIGRPVGARLFRLAERARDVYVHGVRSHVAR